jgi:hypothetical protein
VQVGSVGTDGGVGAGAGVGRVGVGRAGVGAVIGPDVTILLKKRNEMRTAQI